MSPVKRVSWTNVLAVLIALWVGVTCSGCAPASSPAPLAPPAMPDTAYVLLDPRPIAPTPLHIAVRDMIGLCAGKEMTYGPVGLTMADSIIGIPSGTLAYGISGQDERGQVVIIETAFVHNAAVISHEFLHALHAASEGDRTMRACTLYVGMDLPMRTVNDPEMYAYRGVVLSLGEVR